MTPESHDDPLDPTLPLRLACGCGHARRYDDREAFIDAGGTLSYIRRADLYVAECPVCSTDRPVRVGVFSFPEGHGDEVCLSLGEFTAEGVPREDGYGPSDVDFEGVLDPVYVEQWRFGPACPECGSRLTEADLQEGPEAPELGWEYYECPECAHRSRADRDAE